MDMLFDHPYVLIKIGEIDDTLGGKFISPILYPDGNIRNIELWNEFRLNNKHYSICEKKVMQFTDEVYGHEIWGPIVGESFTIRSKVSNGIRTSIVTDILSENIFTTMNSLYFLIDESWKKRKNREQKINEILNGKI